MESLLLWSFVLTLMFAGGHSISQSMSCSTVNGKTICERQRSSGNTAMSSSQAQFGSGGDYQNAAAMTGDTQTGSSSSSFSQQGSGVPFGGFNNFGGNGGAYSGAYAGNANGDGASGTPGFGFSGVPNFGNGGGVFVGGVPTGGFAYAGGFAGNMNPAQMFGGGGGGAFAGGFDPFAFVFGRR